MARARSDRDPSCQSQQYGHLVLRLGCSTGQRVSSGLEHAIARLRLLGGLDPRPAELPARIVGGLAATIWCEGILGHQYPPPPFFLPLIMLRIIPVLTRAVPGPRDEPPIFGATSPRAVSSGVERPLFPRTLGP